MKAVVLRAAMIRIALNCMRARVRACAYMCADVRAAVTRAHARACLPAGMRAYVRAYGTLHELQHAPRARVVRLRGGARAAMIGVRELQLRVPCVLCAHSDVLPRPRFACVCGHERLRVLLY